MPFIAEWAKNYALEWLKDHIKGFLPEILNSNREHIDLMQKKGVLLWPSLSQELRDYALGKAYPYTATILELDPDEVTDIVIEALDETGLNTRRKWIRGNLVAFREELLRMS